MGVWHLAQGFEPPEAADVSEAAQVGLEVITVTRQHQTVAQGAHIGCSHILQCKATVGIDHSGCCTWQKQLAEMPVNCYYHSGCCSGYETMSTYRQ